MVTGKFPKKSTRGKPRRPKDKINRDFMAINYNNKCQMELV